MIASICSSFQKAIQISDINRPFRLRLLSFLSRPRKLNVGVLLVANRSEMDWIGRIGARCFKERRTSKALKVETDSGGEDVFSSASKSRPDHLVIVVNGIIGSAANWRWAAEQFVKKVPDKVIVHQNKSQCAVETQPICSRRKLFITEGCGYLEEG